MQTRDQKYASTIYDKVMKVSEQGEKAKSYGVMSHKLPILIHKAGLVQALAFVASRSEKKFPLRDQFLDDLASTIGEQNRQQLLRRAREAYLTEYIHLTQRVLDALLWYKRFAQSILDVDASETNDDLNDVDADIPVPGGQ